MSHKPMPTTFLPTEGWVRIWQIIGKPSEGIPPIIPVSRSTWWEGCRTGRFPKPQKLGPRTTVWDVADIRALLARDTP